MSLKTMPGSGKSGTSRMSDVSSASVTGRSLPPLLALRGWRAVAPASRRTLEGRPRRAARPAQGASSIAGRERHAAASAATRGSLSFHSASSGVATKIDE